MTLMKQTVIFDMDGLMLDTMLTWKEAERAFLSLEALNPNIIEAELRLQGKEG